MTKRKMLAIGGPIDGKVIDLPLIDTYPVFQGGDRWVYRPRQFGFVADYGDIHHAYALIPIEITETELEEYVEPSKAKLKEIAE